MTSPRRPRRTYDVVIPAGEDGQIIHGEPSTVYWRPACRWLPGWLLNRAARARRERVSQEMELLDAAWGVIANAGWDGMAKHPEWQDAAIRWRDQYHALLDRR